MLDERLDDPSPAHIPEVLIGLSAGGALLTILLVAVSILYRRKTISAGNRNGAP